jgi:hypothetical protein
MEIQTTHDRRSKVKKKAMKAKPKAMPMKTKGPMKEKGSMMHMMPGGKMMKGKMK